ncbi:MAG: radical SAM protein, partial [Campylobacterota bacterium]
MLIDGHGRKVDYLRVSVTERCNFRCQYCMPEKPFSWVPKENLLSYEDLFKFIKVGIDEGIKKVRITGGEPLLREGLDEFIKMIYDYKNDIDLALTTNGFLLPKVAKDLKKAGLKRINVSLDSLNPDIAAKIAQKDVLQTVLKGIDAANEAGLKIKINCVPIKGINDNDILEVLDYCKQKGFTVRFIEFMENHHAKDGAKGLNSDE